MVSFWTGATDSSLLQSIRTSPGDHSASSEMGTEVGGRAGIGFSFGGSTAIALTFTLISI